MHTAPDTDSMISEKMEHYQNESYNLDVRANYIQDDVVYPLFGMEVISPLVIDLMCPERGRKQVCSINGEAKIVNFDIFYFQSPYEPRIAFFIALFVPGWEGLPLQGHYYVAGCHLRSGFKPYSPER